MAARRARIWTSRGAALLDSPAGNHALVDGDKRLGWLAVVVFYGLNDVDLDAPEDRAFELVMSIARRGTSVEQIAARWPNGTDVESSSSDVRTQ